MDEMATPQELARLVALEHPEPHQLLGAHPSGGGVRVRVFRPDALSVHVLPDRGGRVAAARVDPAGLFEARFPGEAAVFGYRLELGLAGGETQLLRDPYSFLPTLGELDLHLAGEGRHLQLWEKLGAHPRRLGEVEGFAFAVWAPQARRVSVVGDFNRWDGRLHPMRRMGQSGIWELFIPGIPEGAHYKYEVIGADGGRTLKLDPLATRTELRPATSGILQGPSQHVWGDQQWLEGRAAGDPQKRPLSVYEVHLGGFRRVPEERGPGAEEVPGGHTGRFLTYRELATSLVEHVRRCGFTHVELLPIAEHPYDPSWGYQLTGYYAPTARFGSPDDLRFLVDQLHQAGIGVLLDWVPAHFARDEQGLRRFDGTATYEHEDPRQGEHQGWGTMIFNYGRNEVKNFLLANALYWLREFHFDGLRVDAVASMLYLDYSRNPGEWIPNRYGGRENLEAIAFLRELNELVHGQHPGAMVVAEESTAWPGVSRPTWAGGLGFTFKWNMGWMHDTLAWFAMDPVHRRFHHDKLTFGLLYAFSENYLLPLSHDEVVHQKRSLLSKMAGDRWQQFAGLRSLYAWMWAHPGKKLLFMGGEFGQWREFSESRSLDWHLLDEPDHRGLLELVATLNRVYTVHRALWEVDARPEGFRWIDAGDVQQSVASTLRFSEDGKELLACVLNGTPVPRHGYRIGVPRGGTWTLLLDTDERRFGGSGMVVPQHLTAEAVAHHGLPWSLVLELPPLGVLWLGSEGP